MAYKRGIRDFLASGKKTTSKRQMTTGQVCRVYTNQSHPEWCGFNYSSGSAIWNNGGDCAYLRNSVGAAIDTRCY